MRKTYLVQLIALITISLLKCNARSLGDSGKTSCGYQSCHPIKDGYINVHLIPHSHDDVGWVKTVDEFYYGTNNHIYRASVQTIYDNVLTAIQKNKQRRFIYVESAFFWKWWKEQAQSERDQLKELVNSGQIEFAGGGWSMNDEAVVNYQSVVDQMTWGLKKLNESFGDCGRPRAGWQIDPFGHSNEMASIFARLGYDGVILGRIDYEDKSNRLVNRSMDMVWRGSNSLGRQTDIFTTTLYNHYDAPEGFCFDVLCEFTNLVDDLDSPQYNIDVRAENFIMGIKDSVGSFQTNNVIVPMGRDFAYQEAESWFRNIDKLIKYVNKKESFGGKKYHLLYSTPSCYIAAVQKQSKGILRSPLKLDDFFPYATDAHSYWTGYYTSRPTLKRYERLGNNFLQVCKQLFALANLPSKFEPQLDTLRDAMGVMQHHDAITGTEKEVVAYDYARLVHMGISDCENVTSEALSSWTNIEANDFNTCLLTNISQCALTETRDTFVVTVYNPLSRLVSKYVRLPVKGTSYSVIGPDGKKVPSEIFPTPAGVRKIPGRQIQTNASLELVFEAHNIPGLGFKSFYVQLKNGDDVVQEDLSLDFNYFNKKGIGFTIDPSTGLINTIDMNGISMNFEQKFWYYNGSNNWMDFEGKPSGAYIFRPDGHYPIEKVSETASFEVYRGDLVTEVRQTFSEYVSQIVRIYENENFVEFDWIVGPLNVGMGWPSNGKEVISRYTTPLNSESTFYTDSNGRELMKRQRDRRPSWNISVQEKESSNYYPVTSKIVIRDEEANMEFAVLTDRAEGGSSLADGEVELMLLRSCVTDDSLGVAEALAELAYDVPIVARGSHYVTLGNIESEQTIAAIEHEIATQKLLDSWIFLSVPTEDTFHSYTQHHSMQFFGLTESLPENVHIMTLEPWTKSSYLLRLEHVFEVEQDPILSQTVTVDLKDLFTTFELKSIRETTLGANQWLKDSARLNFQSASQSDGEDLSATKRLDHGKFGDEFTVDLEPMEIRTFIIEVVPRV